MEGIFLWNDPPTRSTGSLDVRSGKPGQYVPLTLQQGNVSDTKPGMHNFVDSYSMLCCSVLFLLLVLLRQSSFRFWVGPFCAKFACFMFFWLPFSAPKHPCSSWLVILNWPVGECWWLDKLHLPPPQRRRSGDSEEASILNLLLTNGFVNCLLFLRLF